LDEPGPLPEDSVLAATAEGLNRAGHWAHLFDATWRIAYETDEARRIAGDRMHLAPYTIGVGWYSPENVEAMMESGHFSMEVVRHSARIWLPVMLGDARGDRDQVRDLVDPRLHDILDEIEPWAAPSGWAFVDDRAIRSTFRASLLRLRDSAGKIVGGVAIFKPAVGMTAVARVTGLVEPEYFERLERVAQPGRQSAAILFGDLESSSALARRLATASFFALVRRITRGADQAIVDAGGIAGQHAGDGVVGFFLVSELGSESAAARACIAAARAMRDALPAVAARSELDASDLQARFGLHWGNGLFVGQIATSARTEVTALGDQVNETARIEACANGARMLASKDLVERLAPDDAAKLDLDPDHMTYTTLADLDSPAGKARRDAPALAVCEI
jgi:class 3 adenylate cyclase